MRELIKHERLIEFAFESHRYWDLRRWKDAYDAYNKPIRGLDVVLANHNANSSIQKESGIQKNHETYVFQQDVSVAA